MCHYGPAQTQTSAVASVQSKIVPRTPVSSPNTHIDEPHVVLQAVFAPVFFVKDDTVANILNEPCTSNLEPGVMEPIPILPVLFIKKAVVPAPKEAPLYCNSKPLPLGSVMFPLVVEPL